MYQKPDTVNAPYCLEICVESLLSAQNAALGGATRIELCQHLEVGGLTPSNGLLYEVSRRLSIPVHALIRPRAGNFVYTDKELTVMEQDLAFCKKLGINGVVLGFLTDERRIDQVLLKEMVQLSLPMEVTFHRAFDLTLDPFESFEVLKTCGVVRLLTSGQANRAIDGKELIKELVVRSEGKIEVMPGAGVHLNEAKTLLQYTGAKAIHSSARWSEAETEALPYGFGQNPKETSIKNVRTLADILKSLT